MLCSGFFKRTVQKNKHYVCLETQNCSINKAERKRCPACRFQKCLGVGMKLEAVRANRMRGGRNKFGPLYRKDRELKRQKKTLIYDNYVNDDSNLEPKQEPTAQSFPHGSSDQDVPSLYDHRTLSFEPRDKMPFEKNRRHMLGDGTPCDLTLTTHQVYNPYLVHPMKSKQVEHPGGSLPDCTEGSPYMPASPGEIPSLVQQLMSCEMEEQQLRNRVLSHLQQEQASRGRHDCLNTFSIMCKMVDQTLFCLVQWSRGCIFFKELQVEDQMRLLQNCWTELLMLDHIYRQVVHGKEGSILLVTGQQIDLSVISSQAGDTLTNLVTRTHELVSKFQALQVDQQEMVCLKFLVLFSPDVKNLQNLEFVENVQETVNRSLMDYTSQQHHTDKFGQLLLRLTDIRAISTQAEDYLYLKHLSGDLPCNNLLIEMMHAKQS
ncbi:nuclear receptor subfamily 5 group A member 2 isoform X2 [Microcaecilia unicolor]|uniref:Nuclear receptor subfamily 5 group A member 2-like isoform X2 n=1 Tax=Microcaecilia unicolor TaxID=1415580 RepID=A0A6P7XIK9_9AMPH|nr:nuclear receptor subfamily 5 group A member 2-like isoform X2 [Microcaecilia unicolor]